MKHLPLILVTLLPACGGSDDNNATPDAAVVTHEDAPVVVTPDAPAHADCSTARAQLLGSIDSVSTGTVTSLGSNRFYVDASAGGTSGAATSPYLYLSLATGTKASVTDVTSQTSTAWDLAIKRPLLFTNDGDGGPGMGGAVLVDKAFADVTKTDAVGLQTEVLFDADCNPMTDPTGAAATTFATWYDYDGATHLLSPHPGTWIVRGGDGKLYKLAIETYYAMPDGSGGGTAGGKFTIDVAAL